MAVGAVALARVTEQVTVAAAGVKDWMAVVMPTVAAKAAERSSCRSRRSRCQSRTRPSQTQLDHRHNSHLNPNLACRRKYCCKCSGRLAAAVPAVECSATAHNRRRNPRSQFHAGTR